MLEVAEALAAVLEHARPRRPEAVPLSPVVLGRVLAMHATADRDSPPFDKSLRDGYAVRSADCAGGAAELRVVEEVPAGAVPAKAVGPGECARLFTGAPIPDGADAVVMQEDTQLVGDRVRVTDTAVKPGQWVFPRGREMRAGDVVLPTGTALNAAAVGVLAGLGAAEVPVVPWPRVAVLSTGNELVNLADEPGPGQIRNSNGPMLVSLAVRAGAVVHDLGIARDTPGELRDRIESGLERNDVLILAGGVSVGKFDLPRRRARVRAARQPGERVRVLRTVRPAGPAGARRARRTRAADGDAAAGRAGRGVERPADVPAGEAGAGRGRVGGAAAAVGRRPGPAGPSAGRRAARAARRRVPVRPRHAGAGGVAELKAGFTTETQSSIPGERPRVSGPRVLANGPA